MLDVSLYIGNMTFMRAQGILIINSRCSSETRIYVFMIQAYLTERPKVVHDITLCVGQTNTNSSCKSRKLDTYGEWFMRAYNYTKICEPNCQRFPGTYRSRTRAYLLKLLGTMSSVRLSPQISCLARYAKCSSVDSYSLVEELRKEAWGLELSTVIQSCAHLLSVKERCVSFTSMLAHCQSKKDL